jgi:acyl carrier protein
MSDTYDSLVKLLIDVMGLEAHEVQPTSTLGELEVDSLAMVELALLAQKQFGIRIEDEDLTAETTVAQTAELIESKAVPI